MDSSDDDAPIPKYLGDYPNGAYWSADREDAARLPDSPHRPPWVTNVPRSPSNPYPLRMFTEHGCPFALWGPLGEPPPTTNAATRPSTPSTLEATLPISPSLRDRLLTWGDEWDRNGVDAQEFDERGYEMSGELIHELGDLYLVTYSLTFAEVFTKRGLHVCETSK